MKKVDCIVAGKNYFKLFSLATRPGFIQIIIAFLLVTATANIVAKPVDKSPKKSPATNIKTAKPVVLPTLSYTNPATYTAGTPITPLAPASSGVAAAGYNSTPAIFASGLNLPTYLVFDRSGNLFEATGAQSYISKYPAGGGAAVRFGSTQFNFRGLTTDAAGNVYFGSYDGSIGLANKYSANGNTLTTYPTGYFNPQAIAIDSFKNVYVADDLYTAIFKTPDTQAPQSVSVGSGFLNPAAMCLDAAGNLYVADTGHGNIVEVTAKGVQTILATGFNGPSGIAIDLAGNIFVGDTGANLVWEIPAGGGPKINLGSGFHVPAGLAVNPAGVLFVADEGNNAIKKITPTGGYYLDKPLPAGLTFNGTTGIISGTPTASSPATVYTITAYNASGSTSATVSIGVNLPAPPTLSYATPQNYTAGFPITPLQPTSSRVTPVAYAAPVTISNISSVQAIATDAAGNVYLADISTHSIIKIPFGVGAPVTVSNQFTNFTGMAVNSTGDIYVTDGDNLYKLTAGNPKPKVLATGFKFANGVAIDGAKIYIADENDHSIKVMNSDSDTPKVLTTEVTSPSSPAIFRDKLCFDDYANHSVSRVIIGNGRPYPFTNTHVVNPNGIAFDNSGNLFIIDLGDNTIKMLPADGGPQVTIAMVVHPIGIAVDGAGNIYYGDANSRVINVIRPVGGYFINKTLPQGLTLDPNTGIISGRPGPGSGSYSVTAYNYGGSSSASLTINSNYPPIAQANYPTPKTYVAGTAIVPLTPVTTSNTTTPYYPYQDYSDIKTSRVFPTSITASSTGYIYANSVSGLVVKCDGFSQDTLATGLFQPVSLAAGPGLDVYVAEAGTKSIKVLPNGFGSPVTLVANIANLGCLAWDQASHIYFGDDVLIKKASINGGPAVTVATMPNTVDDIKIDAYGNIYAACYGLDHIIKIPANGGPAINIGTGLSNVRKIDIDATGNVYVAEAGANGPKIIFAGDGSIYTIKGDFINIASIAVLADGSIAVGDAGIFTVSRFYPAGGFFTGPLPAGLVLNSISGAITGTPTVVSAATDYGIALYNEDVPNSATVNIAVTAPAPPAISYATPLSFVKNTVITPVTPTVSRKAELSYTAPVALSGGYNKPNGVFVDAAGNIFIADRGNNAVKEIFAASGLPTTLGSGFSKPTGVAVDAGGNVYVVDNGNNAVKKIPSGSNTPVTIGTGFSGPIGLALDAAGNVYVADKGNNAIKKIPVGGGAITTIGSGFSAPAGVAVDAAGNVFVADGGHNAVKMIPADGSAIQTLGTGFNNVFGVAVDAAHNVYVVNQADNWVRRIDAVNPSADAFILSSDFSSPEGIAVDAGGNVYVADVANNAVKKISPLGGFFINKSLSAGLSFDIKTGMISGTPAAISPQANYSVIAYNVGGKDTATFSLKVTGNTWLSNLTLSTGTLTPVFNKATLSYMAGVPTAVSSLKITPTAADATSTIKVNNVTVASGAASAAIPLSTGVNIITIKVTATDAGTKTYTVTVNRASNNAVLSAIKLTPASSLTVVSGADYKDYTTTVPNTETSVKVTPTAQDATATIKVNGVTVNSGAESAAIPLSVGDNIISTVVTAQDGITKKTYAIKVTRTGSNNAVLSAIKVTPASSLTTVTGADYRDYTTTVPNTEASIEVTATAQDATATIKVNGVTIASGAASAPIPLNVGDNVINTVVTAQDGITKKTYSIKVTRTGSGNAVLSAIKLTPVSVLTAVTGADYRDYTTTVPNTETSVTVTPTAQDATATIKVNGATVASGTASASIPLNVGSNVIKTVVTAQDGITAKTYSVMVTRVSNIATLSTLKLTPSTSLTVVSGADYKDYTTTVPNSEASVKITPTATDATATIQVNGATVASGTASASIPLNVGVNVINTVVTAQDGITIKTYSIKFTRQPPAGAGLLYTENAGPILNNGLTVHQNVSPNGDGKGDILIIDGITAYPENKVQIMNRSGVLVYEAKGYDNTTRVFDGHSSTNGKLQQAGTYMYSLEYKDGNETKYKTGFIVLKY